MVVDEFLVRLLVDKVGVSRRERVVPTAVLGHCLELVKRNTHLRLKIHTLLLRHGTGKWELLQVASNTHAHRQRRETQLGQVELAVLGQPLNPLEAPVVDVLGVLGNTVVIGQHLSRHAF